MKPKSATNTRSSPRKKTLLSHWAGEVPTPEALEDELLFTLAGAKVSAITRFGASVLSWFDLPASVDA